jgi:hypothetical protein
MKNKDIKDDIRSIKAEITGITISLSQALTRLNELTTELDRLEAKCQGAEYQEDLLGHLDPEEMLYAELYERARNQYDLYQPTLAMIVRDCVKNGGTIPESPQKKEAEHQCEGIIYFIELTYKTMK